MQMLRSFIHIGNASRLGHIARWSGLQTWPFQHVLAIRPFVPCTLRILSTRAAPRPFTPEEDQTIIQRRKERTFFQDIAAESGRNPLVVRCRYALHLVHRDPSAPRGPPKGRTFTSAEYDLIVQLCKEGKTRTEIAATLGLPHGAVSRRIRGPLRDKLSGISQHRKFTAEDDAKILRLRATGNTFSHIAREIGRTGGCLQGRHHRLTKPLSMLGGTTRAWSEAESENLLDLHHDGLSTTDIAICLGRSRYSVQQKLRDQLIRTGTVLTDKKIWSPSQREQLLLFRDKYKLAFQAIADKMPGRTAGAAQVQYHRLKQTALRTGADVENSMHCVKRRTTMEGTRHI